MQIYGYHGTERYIASRILFNHSWAEAESANELGTGIYLYVDDKTDEAVYFAKHYPMGIREDPTDAIVVLKTCWEDVPSLDLDADSIKKLFLGFKSRYNGKDNIKNENARYLQSQSVDSFCKFLALKGINVRMIKKVIGLPHAPYKSFMEAMCVCVRDITVLSQPEKVKY